MSLDAVSQKFCSLCKHRQNTTDLTRKFDFWIKNYFENLNLVIQTLENINDTLQQVASLLKAVEVAVFILAIAVGIALIGKFKNLKKREKNSKSFNHSRATWIVFEKFKYVDFPPS